MTSPVQPTSPMLAAQDTQDDSGVFSVFKQDTNRSTPFYCRWTSDEDKLLVAAVKKYGPHKWSMIAQHVPNRTPVQCSTRWLGALNPNVHKGRWAPEEDEILTRSVQKYSHKSVLPWNRIAQQIPNRTGIQCQARWTEALDPTVRKGRWKKEEDEMLRAGVARYGCCWIRVSSMIFGRTQRQCRTRWNQIKSKEEKMTKKAAAAAALKKQQPSPVMEQQQQPVMAMDDDESNAMATFDALSIQLPDLHLQQQQNDPMNALSPTISLPSPALSFSPAPVSPVSSVHPTLMPLPSSITIAMDPSDTDYFCLSPPSPSSSLDEMLTLPDDELVPMMPFSTTMHQQEQPTLFTPCEFFRFNPELPSLNLPDSDLMINDLLVHPFAL
ncbi:Homeodomain-like protein [Gongronella butleri]|nr:Homeodomain-like protein [Gongronella butleri]